MILILKDILLIFLVAQMVKNQPLKQETQVRSLGQEDPLGEEMATHSSVLAREIPWTEEPGGATVHSVTQSQPRLKLLSMGTKKQLMCQRS